MPGLLLQLCAAHRSSSLLLDEYRHLTQAHQRALSVRPAVAAVRLRRRRACRAPATHLQKRRIILGSRSFNKLLEHRLDMASQQAIRRRYSVADRVPADSIMPTTAATSSPDSSNPSTTDAPVAMPLPGSASARDLSRARQEKQPESTSHSRQDSAASTASMPPPPVTREDTPPFRRGHSRSKSSMCRQVNRLSLTLPIAPPTSDPSRPTPTSAMSSVPPTPIDSAVTSPTDANEFIIAIATQERRVMELREELSRAETDLIILKKKWSTQDTSRKRGEQFPIGAARPAAQAADDEPTSAKRSVDMDRRKLLQQDQSQPSTPQSRRKVMRGGHTRTLSLLSPGKDGFSLFEDRPDQEPVTLPPIERRAAQLTNPNLAKRASWAPRSQQNVAGVPQIVEDFKLGLRAFVEDIRQITVGDEPITGQQLRSTGIDLNQDTIRPSHALRPKVSTVFEPPHSAESTPSRGTKTGAAAKETQDKAKTTKSKHFSWTPLGVDSLDDNDWSNWESPASTKTSRWSGSTMGSSLDDTPDEEPVTTPSKRKSLGFDNPLLSPKLEEISNMVNRLTPSNIKRTATNLMDEWEKSLTEPQMQQRRVSAQAKARVQAQNKENSV
ncbi:hypothetical protein G7Z17_g9056 [Cylindrodendrum hubeiense]|uniref:DUF4048 domain-containing protein n=1 Tax=Cylindrodendrum hubeiense TaxID=595255 RepID=A0A9P5H419_9HYPO|nr:hypothetical protein G7Z17_g9056 [Cylindrodendrum hubeiense]